MRHEVRKLTLGATGGNAGTALDIRDLTDAVVVVDGTDEASAAADVFSVKVQVKIAAAPGEAPSDVWFDITGALAASTLVPLDRIAASVDLGGFSMPFTHVRVYSTTIGAKAPRARVAGRNTRTDH